MSEKLTPDITEFTKIPEELAEEVAALALNVETMKNLMFVLMISGEEAAKNLFVKG